MARRLPPLNALRAFEASARLGSFVTAARELRVSAAAVPVLRFRGRVEPRGEHAPPLLFDVYSPRGLRYQVLLGTPRTRTIERHGELVERATRTREAALAVAGSSIVLTSMYGRWRVEPRLEGESQACGRPEYFTIWP